VGVVLERRAIACAESWPSFIWGGGLRTEVVRPAPGCDASLRSDAWDSHLDSKGQAQLYLSMEIEWAGSQQRPSRSPSYTEVMLGIHGRNIWEERIDGLGQMFAWLGIDRPMLFSPSSSPGFVGALVNATSPRFVLEVGTFLGKTTVQIAQAMALSEKLCSGFVVSLDTWLGDAHMWSDKRHRRCIECDQDYFDTLMTRQGMPMFYFQYLYNVMHCGVQRHVVPFPMATNGAARVLHFHDWHPDMVYIDASHHALDVLQDLESAAEPCSAMIGIGMASAAQFWHSRAAEI